MDVLHDGVIVKRLGGQDGSELPPTFDPLLAGFVPSLAGSVNVSRQQIGRDGSATFLDLAGVLTPDDVNDLFAPLIAEIRPWIGIIYHDATQAEKDAGDDVEWIPLATLPVLSVEGTWPQKQVSGQDRLSFLQPFVGNYSTGTTSIPTDQALTNLLTAQIPAAHLQLNIPDTEFTTPPTLYTEQDSSLDAAHALALSMGMRLFADPMGVITVAPEASTDDPPAISYAPGPDSMMLRPQRNVDASGAKNTFVVTGESASGVLRGVAQDLDPNSLTYVGRVGPRPFFEANPLMQSPAQCVLAAKTIMARELGIADTIAVPVVPNPALDAGDVIQVSDPDQSINFPLVVDSFSVPLRASDGAMSIQCRSRVIRS